MRVCISYNLIDSSCLYLSSVWTREFCNPSGVGLLFLFSGGVRVLRTLELTRFAPANPRPSGSPSAIPSCPFPTGKIPATGLASLRLALSGSLLSGVINAWCVKMPLFVRQAKCSNPKSDAVPKKAETYSPNQRISRLKPDND